MDISTLQRQNSKRNLSSEVFLARGVVSGKGYLQWLVNKFTKPGCRVNKHSSHPLYVLNSTCRKLISFPQKIFLRKKIPVKLWAAIEKALGHIWRPCNILIFCTTNVLSNEIWNLMEVVHLYIFTNSFNFPKLHPLKSRVMNYSKDYSKLLRTKRWKTRPVQNSTWCNLANFSDK